MVEELEIVEEEMEEVEEVSEVVTKEEVEEVKMVIGVKVPIWEVMGGVVGNVIQPNIG